MSIKILLLGKKGAGKTTVARYICDKYGLKELTFADPLKKVCQTMFNLSEGQLHDHEQKEIMDHRWGYSSRQIFQKFGDLLRDQIPIYFDKLPKDPKIFVQIMDNKIKNKGTDNGGILISDGRLPDEVNWFKTLPYGYIIKIVNNRVTTNDAHISETYEYNGDDVITIYNNGTLQELYNSVDNIIGKLI
jgi:adenylate kinase family enzyme